MAKPTVRPRMIDLVEVAYTSEWALAKFFPVIFEDGLSDFFNLVGIYGREQNREEVRDRLLDEIGKRGDALLKGKTWRIENTLKETKSAINLLESLANNQIFYTSIKNQQLPSKGYDAGVVFTSNTTHLPYIEQLLDKGIHVLCEKPLVPVTDQYHNADRKDLENLERLVEKYKKSLIMMDSEHYSAKKATRIFFEKFGEMIAGYGSISKISGHTKEKDDPEKDRTRKLLSTQNRTGLLVDMGVHLFGIITNIKGEIGDILQTEYSIYPGYDVETYVKTGFKVEGNLFYDNAEVEFTFAKFVDRFRGPEECEDKKVEITFENRGKGKTIDITVVTIDFSKGTVSDTKGIDWYTESSNQEYVNILRDFYNAIIRKKQPRTSFEHSIKSLDAIWRVYDKYPVLENLVEVYKK